jgi:hypothetical protein
MSILVAVRAGGLAAVRYMPQSDPFEVAVVTQRVTPAGAIVAGEYDQVSEFVRCAEM